MAERYDGGLVWVSQSLEYRTALAIWLGGFERAFGGGSGPRKQEANEGNARSPSYYAEDTDVDVDPSGGDDLVMDLRVARGMPRPDLPSVAFYAGSRMVSPLASRPGEDRGYDGIDLGALNEAGETLVSDIDMFKGGGVVVAGTQAEGQPENGVAADNSVMSLA